MTDVEVATLSDVAEAVALHRVAFPQSVLTRLGDDVLERYYRSLFGGPHDVRTLVARDRGTGRPVGLVLGGVFHGSAIGFLRQERGALVRALARRPWLLLSADVRQRASLALSLVVSMRRRSGAERPSRVPEGSFGVLVVAVDPAAQGQGVGTVLLTEIAEQARARGFARVHLTAGRGASNSVAFYERLGWRRSPVDGGRWDGLMVRELDEAGPSWA